MEPRDDVGAAELRGLRVDLLRQAVEVYLAQAYPNGEIPEAVRKRLDWPEGADMDTLVAHPPFERATRPGPGRPIIYALRLGNARYPHMKLQVQAWPIPAGFMLSVNTHDQVLGLDPNDDQTKAFRALQAENQRLKESIELAWDAAGLPTFLRYLRDYIALQNKSNEASATGI